MAVPLVDCGICGEAVKVAATVDVVDPNTIGALDHYVQRMIVMGAIEILEFHKIMSAKSVVVHGHMNSFEFLSDTPISSRTTNFLPEASLIVPCARRGRSWPGGNTAPSDRHRLTCPVRPFAAADGGSARPFSCVGPAPNRSQSGAA